jgi:hypothetical protein
MMEMMLRCMSPVITNATFPTCSKDVGSLR